jgi:hypothetical protein
MGGEGRNRAAPRRSFPVTQVHPDASRHPSKHGRRDAHRLRRDEHSLVPKRSDARNFLSTAAHLLRKRVRDLSVRARLDANRLCFCLRREPRRVCGRLRLEPRALRDGFRRRDGRVRICVRLRLRERRMLSDACLGIVVRERRGTYAAGFGFDARDGEDTFFLLDLVAVFTIDVLWEGGLHARSGVSFF